MSQTSFWGSKVRQFRAHRGARVSAEERAAVGRWLSPEQAALFDGMHVADQRHGLDVVATLRDQGATDHELLLAGLLHDAGKGDTGVWPRVTIGRDTWIGDRAIVQADVGKHCVIGAGAVVTKPIPDLAVAVGVPARVVRYRDGSPVPKEEN